MVCCCPDVNRFSTQVAHNDDSSDEQEQYGAWIKSSTSRNKVNFNKWSLCNTVLAWLLQNKNILIVLNESSFWCYCTSSWHNDIMEDAAP